VTGVERRKVRSGIGAGVNLNSTVSVNGRSPYVLECHYQDPAGTLHVFKSRNLFFDPVELEGRQIRVYVDHGDMDHYYVDVESVVPDIQVH